MARIVKIGKRPLTTQKENWIKNLATFYYEAYGKDGLIEILWPNGKKAGPFVRGYDNRIIEWDPDF